MITPVNTNTPPNLERSTSPFHEGERAIQARLGIDAKMASIGNRIIRDYMPDQHRQFFAELPFVAVASVDANSQPWATLLYNAPGFLNSPDPTHLHIAALADRHDPLHSMLKPGASIGLLGIQFHTRRRNRMNGRIVQKNDHGLTVEVQQSFGNCPKYIQARHCEYSPALQLAETKVVKRLDIDADMIDIIQSADTFFIASAHHSAISSQSSRNGVDISHRGGKPGFVHIDGNTLQVPDYLGNFMFNTLGNMHTHPKVGLLFVDFDKGHLLHVTAEAEIVWDDAALQNRPGAQRLLIFRITQAVLVKRHLPLRWSGWELSPHLADK
jgi:uncharacterized protein